MEPTDSGRKPMKSANSGVYTFASVIPNEGCSLRTVPFAASRAIVAAHFFEVYTRGDQRKRHPHRWWPDGKPSPHTSFQICLPNAERRSTQTQHRVHPKTPRWASKVLTLPNGKGALIQSPHAIDRHERFENVLQLHC